MNLQGKYDSYECIACGKTVENQKHILECTILLKMNTELKPIIEYEKIVEGTVNEQLKIARLFKHNFDIVLVLKWK